MLRRVDNVGLHLTPRFMGRFDFSIQVGRKRYVISRRVQRETLATWNARQRKFPQSMRIDELGRTYWNFANRWWSDNDGLNAQQVHALLVTRLQRESAKIERAQGMVAMRGGPRTPVRGSIPDDVKQYVWARDEGRCRACGATTELQFDHVIPVVMGGGSAADNLQILCGPCNRRKGAGLASQ